MVPLLCLFILQEFELTLDIDRLIRQVDKDGSGFLDYEEFKSIMT